MINTVEVVDKSLDDSFVFNVDLFNNIRLEELQEKEKQLLKNNKKLAKKLSFVSDDGRIKIEQEDVIAFLKKQPDNSVDLIVTDPAYSGMNQMLIKI
jgi:DNA modification methylase